MSEPFTLVIPVEPRFRVLASDVAGRYAELVGGARAGVSAAVAAAVEAIAQAAAGNGAEIHVTFRPSPLRQGQSGPGAVAVDLRCGAATRTITCPL